MANSVKIPAELEMSNISSQISSLRQTLKGVKVESSSFKTLNSLLQNMEKSFNNLQAESKKTFSSQTEITHFVKGLEKLNLQAQVFQENLSRVDIKQLNIDTSTFDAAVKKIKELETSLDFLQAGKVGKLFDGTEVGKAAAALGKGIKPNETTFSGLVKAFDEAADNIRNTIQTIDSDIQKLLNKKVSTDNFSQFFDSKLASHSGTKLSTAGKNKAAADISSAFNVNFKDLKVNSNNLQDFIEANTAVVLEKLYTRQNNIQKEIDKAKALNKAITEELEKLPETTSKDSVSTVSAAEKGIIESNLGFSVKSNNVAEIRKYLSARKEAASTVVKGLEPQLKNLNYDAVKEKVIAVVGQIQEEVEVDIKNLLGSLSKELVNKEVNQRGTNVSLNAGETLEQLKQRLLKQIEELNQAIEAEKAGKEAERATQQGQEGYYRGLSSTVQTKDVEQQQKVGQTQEQLEAAKEGAREAAAVMEEEAKAARDAKGAVEELGDSCESAGHKSGEAAENLQSLNTATNSLANVKRVVGYWLSFQTVMRGISSTVKSAISEIHELDDVMTEIAIVTDFTQEDLWGQMGKYSSIAQEYGTSIKGVYEVSQLFYQQGLQQNQVWELTTETLKMAKIAGLDYATAADYISYVA